MEMLTVPELCSSIPSTTPLRENLANYFEETKNLIEKLTTDLSKQPLSSSSSHDESSSEEVSFYKIGFVMVLKKSENQSFLS